MCHEFMAPNLHGTSAPPPSSGEGLPAPQRGTAAAAGNVPFARAPLSGVSGSEARWVGRVGKVSYFTEVSDFFPGKTW